MSPQRPVRILHVFGGMARGGAETYVMNVLRGIDRTRFRMDFLVHTTRECDYDAEIQSLGSSIIHCPFNSQPWRYDREFRRILAQQGPYDVVHSHVYTFSGYVLRAASRAGVPIRIAHSHTDTSRNDGRAGLVRRGYIALMKSLVQRYATRGFGCSRNAVAALFGHNWESDPRWQVLPCTLDMSPFSVPVQRSEVREELGIPNDAYVLGHVGSFREVKNHHFLVDVFAETAGRAPDTWLLLVGDGPLRPDVHQQVEALGLQDRVVFAGLRPDVPRLMLAGMDLFVLPSLYEGFGIVLIEAQAAGLPCVCSDVIPPEVDVLPALLRRRQLSAPAAAWAEAIMELREQSPIIAQSAALSQVMESPFSIGKGLGSLEQAYSGAG